MAFLQKVVGVLSRFLSVEGLLNVQVLPVGTKGNFLKHPRNKRLAAAAAAAAAMAFRKAIHYRLLLLFLSRNKNDAILHFKGNSWNFSLKKFWQARPSFGCCSWRCCCWWCWCCCCRHCCCCCFKYPWNQDEDLATNSSKIFFTNTLNVS